MATSFNNWVVAFLVLLTGLILLLYSATLHAPFNFDDEAVIKSQVVEGAAIKTNSAYYNFYPLRYRHLFYLSLVSNYSQGKLDPFGYHLINTSLHILTSIVVFFIAFTTIKRGLSWGEKEAYFISAITTLFFSLNPVHSETINYISARAVGMSSFFYLFALLMFILGSFCERNPISRLSYYLLSLAGFVASILSKETSLTFPATILLYDICFMRKNGWTPIRNRLLSFYIPLLACGVFVLFKVLSMNTMILEWLQKADLDYALKQARVIGHGFYLLLFPIGLTFDYDFPDAFFPHPVLRTWPILLFLGLVLVAARFFRNALPIISFGILWFLLTLAPTNSILPRPDLLSERNLYLPSFGVFLLLSISGYHLVLAEHNRSIIKRIGVSCLVVLFMFEMVLIHKRNSLYRSNILLWEDTLKKAPGNLQALHNLSHFYIAEKKHKKAFVALQSLAKSKASPHYISFAHSNLGTLYLQLGEYSKAEAEFRKGISIKPSLPTNYLNLGTVFASQGRHLEAKNAYEKTEHLYKKYKWGYQIPPELYLNKARLLLTLGLHYDAENSAIQYLKRLPEAGLGHFVLASIYAAMGKYENALREYSQSGNDPKLKSEAHNNMALIFIQQNLFDRALEELNQAVTIFPILPDAHYNLANLLIQTSGDLIKARRHLETALKLTTNLEGQRRIKRTLDTLS